ncbi:Secondary metabolism regulator [Lachnellula subtilissima]|uniref:Secondary metabolism regulator n=1 Tax=Lachnellula subtilissima TaxID=602034 RepID=A0A8H8UDT2_9HELO|nr:Secondary metabolism regulator [Lachnellula subtilissima]
MTEIQVKSTSSSPKAESSTQTLAPQPQPQSESQPDIEPESQPDIQPDVQPDIQPEVLPEPQIQEAAQDPADNQANDAIEPDDNDALERDSAFGGNSIASSKTSLTEGITKYRQENGRRYHAYRDGKYLFPNDELSHVFTLVYEGRLYFSPLENPHRVLDAGTGTGIWAIDFADRHPESFVIGSDLSPIQPGWIPPNLEFEVDDIEDTWRHKPFDFIHMRMMAGSIKDWPALIAQAYANLQPGGWLEFCEFEVWVHCQNDTEVPQLIHKWQTGLTEAGERIGRTFNVAPNLKRWMEEAGFVGITQNIIKVPDTPWPKDPRWKEVGLYQQQNMLDASSAYGQAHFTRVLGWSVEEFQVLSAGVRRELKNLKYHMISNLHVVYGQKPKDDGAGGVGH